MNSMIMCVTVILDYKWYDDFAETLIGGVVSEFYPWACVALILLN